MSKSTLEGKIGKTLRKANRLKTTHARLECVDDALVQVRSLLAPFAPLPDDALTATQQREKQRLEHYAELCHLHKLKFQIDAVLAAVTSGLRHLGQDPQLRTGAHIEPLASRLRAVMALDSEYFEAQELWQRLAADYPQYVPDMAAAGRYLSLAPYQAPDMRIVITCRQADLEKHAALRGKYPLYHVPEALHSGGDPVECRLRFSLKDLDDFELFHEELRTHAGYQIRINGRPIQEQHLSDWLHCYMRFRKADNPNYCYGASPFTYNVFGCHKLYTPDLAKRLDLCWFSHGALDPDSGLFFLEPTRLLHHLTRQLDYCGFCPALTQEKLSIGSNLLPSVLNPECDDRWQYWPPQRTPEYVVPVGRAMVIAPAGIDFSHLELSQVIEVAPTPYIDKLLRYLDTGDLRHLNAQVYRGLSTCIHCGGPYKPHTMICGKCRVDFWKYALQDIEQALAQLRVSAPMPLPAPASAPVPVTGSAPPPRAAISPVIPPAPPDTEGISFEQLWNDPQVRHMLTQDAPAQSPAVSDLRASEPTAAAASRPPQAPESQARRDWESLRAVADTASAHPETRPVHASEEHLRLHEKIWGLLSKKYRERKAIETAFSPSSAATPMSPGVEAPIPSGAKAPLSDDIAAIARPAARSPAEKPASRPTAVHPLRKPEPGGRQFTPAPSSAEETGTGEFGPEHAALLNAIKSLKTRQKSELSKRGVVRVVYLATMDDKDTCPLCAYLDGMVMDPDDPATDIFSPPLYSGCTCRREYVLKTEKPQNWPRVTFKFPPKDLLIYLDT